MNATTFNHNLQQQRYELIEGGHIIGIARYQIEGDAVKLTHTNVEPQHAGKGHGSALASMVLEDIRSQNRKVIASCHFIVAYIRKNPQYAAMLNP